MGGRRAGRGKTRKKPNPARDSAWVGVGLGALGFQVDEKVLHVTREKFSFDF